MRLVAQASSKHPRLSELPAHGKSLMQSSDDGTGNLFTTIVKNDWAVELILCLISLPRHHVMQRPDPSYNQEWLP